MASPEAFVSPPLQYSLYSPRQWRPRCNRGRRRSPALTRTFVPAGGVWWPPVGRPSRSSALRLVAGLGTSGSSTPLTRGDGGSPPSATSANGDVSPPPAPGSPPYVVPDELVAVGCAAADAAGVEVRKWFRSPSLTVETKADTSPVTAADRAVESAVREVFAARVPTHGVLGEEGDGADAFAVADVGADVDPDGGREVFTWVVDPIDGTKSFMTGKATFGTLIALLRNGVPVFGIIDQPITRERWVGATGRPSELRTGRPGESPAAESVPVCVKGKAPSDVGGPTGGAVASGPSLVDAAAGLSEAQAVATLSSAFVYATAPEMFMGDDVAPFSRVVAAAKHVLYGADCYGYALLASGHTDAVVEADLKPWDFLALIPIIQGAGGTVTDWAGAPLTVRSDGRVVAAADPAVHAAALRVLGSSALPTSPSASAAADAATKDADLDAKLRLPELERRVWDVASVGNGAVTGIAVDPMAMLQQLEDAASGASDGPTPPAPSSPEDRGLGYVESMTGFGQCVIDDGHTWAVHVELRSINSRYCDVNLRLPRYLSKYESEFSASLKSSLVRGKVIAGMEVRRLTSVDDQTNVADLPRGMPVRVDTGAVRSIRALLDEVASTAGLTGPAAVPTLSDVLSFSEVFTKRESEDVATAVLPLVRSALGGAIDDLRSSRRREGAALEAALDVCVSQIQTLLNEVEARAPVRVEKERRRLRERLLSSISEVLSHGHSVNESRLEMELAVAADRLDVSEEVVRLRSHVQLFQLSFVGVDGPIGSRLNFLTQEMHREASTIAAKANDSPMAQCAIRIKEELERMREQVQNIR